MNGVVAIDFFSKIICSRMSGQYRQPEFADLIFNLVAIFLEIVRSFSTSNGFHRFFMHSILFAATNYGTES
jgi:hypothetical protein